MKRLSNLIFKYSIVNKKLTAILGLVVIATTINPVIAQQRLKVQVTEVDSSFDTQTRAKLKAAIQLLDSVINTNTFAKMVEDEEFTVGAKGFDSKGILKLIMLGQDSLSGYPADYNMHLRLKVFDDYEGSGNFGYTNMQTHVTRTHRCFILQNDLKCYVSHLAHEYMHAIGFTDDRYLGIFTKTKSVPYKIGNIIDQIIGNTSFCSAKNDNCKKGSDIQYRMVYSI